MLSKAAAGLTFSLVTLFAAGCAVFEADDGRPWRAVSDTRVGGFVFPESVGCDTAGKVLYVGNFGGTELKPAEKDGKGYISKVGLDGKVIEESAFNVTLNKPKGIWIEGGRLWVTDIDSVWIFDLASKRGRRLELPGIQFANDPAVQGSVLFVTDNRSDQLFRVEPADFLDAKVQPKVSVAWSKKSINPNGVYPARDGSILVAGFMSADQPRGIHAMAKDGSLKAVTQPIGRLDGLYEMRDGSILATDWNSGSLFHWSAKGGKQDLAKDFKGPADFCVMGDTVYVPDLPASQVRIIRLGK
jgi:hypothetical protein